MQWKMSGESMDLDKIYTVEFAKPIVWFRLYIAGFQSRDTFN